MKRFIYLAVGISGALIAGAGGWFLANFVIDRNGSSFPEVKAQANQKISEARQTALVNAAQRVSPGVVSVSVISERHVTSSPFFDPFWSPFIPPNFRTERVVSLGSGFIVSQDGYIVTNEHVIHGGDSIIITLSDGRSYQASLVGSSERLDIALLKVKAKNLPTVKMGDSETLMPGEWCLAVGNPVGYLLEDLNPTITVGVISATGRTIKREESGRIYRDMIQTDAAVNPGNSGGPLCDAEGEVVGMNTFIFSKSGGSEGLGFAIPSNTVVKAVGELKAHGRIREAYIGVSVQNITRDIAEAMGYKGYTGVAVVSAEKNTGLAPGDIIVQAGGRDIRIEGDWEDATFFLLPGETVPVKVFRDGKYLDITLKAREAKATGKKTSLGMTVAELTPSLKQKYNVPEDKGLVVTEVKKGSFADRMGLAEGDLILKVNGMTPRTPGDFEKAVNSKPGFLEMLISRSGTRFYLSYSYSPGARP